MRTLRALCLLSVLGAGFGVQLAPDVANAQEAQVGEFSVQRFEPAPGTKNYLSVEGARMEAAVGFSVGLMFDYARDPFVVRSCLNAEDCSAPNALAPLDTHVVRDMLTWNVLASVTPLRFLQVGLRIPVAYASGDGIVADTGQADPAGLAKFGLGDPMLEGKVRVYGEPQDPVVIGFAVDLSAPLGSATAENSYIGSSSPLNVGARAIFDGHAGPLSFGINLRAKITPEEMKLGNTAIGPVEFRYGAGVGYEISPVFMVLAEGYGGTKFETENGTNSLEIDGAIRVMPIDSGLVFTAGGGAGILQGVGVPVARAIAGVVWSREPGDEDGDGVDDKDDGCSTVPEDEDGFEDDDGCPDDDNDRDGVSDDKDKCKDKPETINGLKDDDGCPDAIADKDKDSILDADDKCPDQPGGARSKDWYGCPDKDRDGVADPADACIDTPEDTDGFEDTDGCRDPDNDGDTVPDEADECVDQSETVNGIKDTDGCPD